MEKRCTLILSTFLVFLLVFGSAFTIAESGSGSDGSGSDDDDSSEFDDDDSSEFDDDSSEFDDDSSEFDDDSSGSDDDDSSGSDDDDSSGSDDDDSSEFDDDDSSEFDDDKEEDNSGSSLKDEYETESKDGETKTEINKRYYDENGNLVETKIKIEEKVNSDGVVERKIKIEGKQKGLNSDQKIEIESKLNMKIYLDEDNKTSLKVNLSDGSEERIISPDEAIETALKLIGNENLSIELDESEMENRAVFKIRANKTGRFLAVFKMKVKIEGEIDAQTGNVTGFKKPFLSFLISGEDAKVEVCHLSARSTDSPQTLSIAAPAVVAHIKHGDKLGSCEDSEEEELDSNLSS